MYFSLSLGSGLLPMRLRVVADGFGLPSFLPKEAKKIQDPFARKLAMRIERLPVHVRFSENPIMSSCVKPLMQTKETPVVLLHGFDSSCLEWRYAYPLLEESGFETWAVDILGWGFSDLEKLPPCDVVSKRDHFYQFWKSYIRRPMMLVGPSLGSAVAIDFAVNYPEAVEKLVLIDASVYAEGTGNLATLPRAVAYAGVYLLKSFPLRLLANYLNFTNLSFSTSLDWTNVGRLHCLLPWWDDATVDFMTSGGYNVASLINKVKQKTLIIWGENDRIISNKFAVQLHCELPDAIVRQIPNCGHLPHVERPDTTIKLIAEFLQREAKKLNQCVSQV
ncbi:alpha/beta hydrolase domain-containing protein VTE7 [Gastrolobium bilobum]|uniref:alpha/beta hydrolase domain-containing protein VTE7 n=1 Tax=Gastrolobium bilobum TaxID=150636 RepID=UPI002AB1C8C7|nr:alpha/beta hydrolase domain-containing protein VTE7 [Gastrolobium bilobum]